MTESRNAKKKRKPSELERLQKDEFEIRGMLRKHDNADDCIGCGCFVATAPELVAGLLCESKEMAERLKEIAALTKGY